jgi:hypothetical protein
MQLWLHIRGTPPPTQQWIFNSLKLSLILYCYLNETLEDPLSHILLITWKTFSTLYKLYFLSFPNCCKLHRFSNGSFMNSENAFYFLRVLCQYFLQFNCLHTTIYIYIYIYTYTHTHIYIILTIMMRLLDSKTVF